MSNPVEVMSAEVSAVDALVETLVAAHVDHAWEQWAVDGDDRQLRLTAGYRSDLLDVGFPHGVVHATRDAASVAVWIPAGFQVGERQELASYLFGDRAALVADVDERVTSAPCPPTDWYLATMGTRPDRQRHGLGSAVLAPMLARLDERNETAKLDTSSLGNVRFYERQGFEVVAELDLPHGAPTTWIMHRRSAVWW